MDKLHSTSCCAPAAAHERAAAPPYQARQTAVKAAIGDVAGSMVSLPGGTFLMGTDYPGGFPEDGEGPVVPSPFRHFKSISFQSPMRTLLHLSRPPAIARKRSISDGRSFSGRTFPRIDLTS